MSRRQLPGTVLHLLPETGVTDQGNYGNDGTYNGGMGVVGGEFVFDGVDDYVSVPQFQSDQALDFSVSVWFSVDNTARIKNVIFANDGYSNGIMLMSHPWNGHDLLFYIKSGAEHIQFSIPGYANNTLFHVVITKVYADSYAKAWVNGVEVTAVNLYSRPSIDPRSSQPFLLGAQVGYGYLDGTESDFRYFNRVITAGEVALLYNKGVPGYEPFGLLGGEVLALEMSRHDVGVLDGTVLQLDGSTGVTDQSPEGNDGTYNGGMGVTAGKFVFDGVDDSITVNDSLSLEPANVTVSVWFKPNGAQPSDTHFRRLVVKTYSPTLGVPHVSYGFIFDAAGTQIAAIDSSDQGSPDNTTAKATFNQNEWNHAVMTYDGITMRLYLDGVQVATDAHVTTIAYNTGPLLMGRSFQSGSALGRYNGELDDLRILDRAISAAEVLALYNNDISDESGNGNNGTLTGGASVVGDAIVFDGVDGGITATVPAVIGDGSVSLWVKFDAIPSGTHVVFGAAIGGTYILINQYGSSLLWYWQTGGAGFSTPSAVSVGPLYHLVMVRSGSTMIGYIDGVQVGTAAATNNWANGNISIGYWPGASGRELAGDVSDVRVFDRALTPAEVAFLASAAEVEVPDTRGSVLAIMPSYDEWGNLLVNAVDFSGKGNPGTLTNMDVATDWVADTADGGVRALDFDGSNDYVEVPTPIEINNQDFTISMWVNPLTPNQSICSLLDYSHATGGSGGYGSWVIQSENATSGRHYYLAYNSGTNVSAAFQPAGFLGSGKGIQVTNGVWQHLVYTKSGTTVRGYLNGTLVWSPAAASSSTVYYRTDIPLILMSVNGMSRNAKGRQDAVLLYDRVLTSAEITLLAASRNSFAAVAGGNPVGILQNNIQSMRLGI